MENSNNVDILAANKTRSPKSPGEFTGLAWSPARSPEGDGDPESRFAGDGGIWPPPGQKSKKRGKPFKPGQEEDAEKEPESKLAASIAEVLVDSLCYDEIGGDWYAQASGLWCAVSEKKALKQIMKVLDAKQPDGYGISKLNNIKSFLQIYLLLDKWASVRHLLPMNNGVLDTHTMQLTAYSHSHKFNWQLPYSYKTDAKIDVIKRWLWEASGQDPEAVNIIRAFFKMALIGGDVQKFLELIGAGGTGKSTLIRLLVAFIGDKNQAATDLKNLETNRFEAAGLYGKRLVLISDSSRYGGEVSTLKALTGGDPVRFEKKNVQQCGSFVFDGVVVVASNEAIQTADYSSGLIRRRMPVNFNRKVTDEDKARWAGRGGIEAVMHKELPGLLNWVLSMPDTEVKAVIGGINGEMTLTQRNHLVETNKIAAWIDDNTVINPEAVTYVGCSAKGKTESEASQARREKSYANYEAWCSDGAVHPVALQRFTANLIDVCEQLKLDVTAMDKNKHGKPIRGIAVRAEHHNSYATPVTRKLIGDPETRGGDPAVTRQTRAGDDGDPDDPINSMIKNTTVFNEEPEYF